MTQEEKLLDKLTGSVILNQLALDYNEALKHTKFYKHKLKSTLNLTVKELIKAEQNEFDKVFEVDEEQTTNISELVLHTINSIKSFKDTVLLGSILAAHEKNPKAIEGIVKKILT